MSVPGRVRLTAIARGRVQGVGYRMFAIDRARGLGLSGYARNLPDGRAVEIVAEGPRRMLERLVDDLRRGPHGAAVSQVDATWSPAQDDLDGFGVRW